MVKRPYKRISKLYFGGNSNNKEIKKPYIQDSKLYLSEDQIKQIGGFLPLGTIAAQLLPVGLQALGKIFGGKEEEKEEDIKLWLEEIILY